MWTARPARFKFISMAADEPFQELARALRERLAIIGDRDVRENNPAAHLERLREASEKIAMLQARLPREIDPRLDHFLKRCSYDKALAFLEEMTSENR